jgi:hypothetical protein
MELSAHLEYVGAKGAGIFISSGSWEKEPEVVLNPV